MENNIKIDIEKVNAKNQLIDDAIVQLKKEFVGIDYQIDTVMDNLRTWFLFPELQERPMIINLFGMSGCGKTQLVKRISELLKIERDYVYFNFAQIDEMNAWEIEDTIEEQLSSERSNRMFIYDEFQYAATLDETGCEKDKKSGLKTFWELLDTGILEKKHNYGNVRSMLRLMRYMEIINRQTPIQLKNGVWVNADECLKGFGEYEKKTFGNFFNFHLKEEKTPKGGEYIEDDCGYDRPVLIADSINSSNEMFIRDHYLERIYEYYDRTRKQIDKIDFHNMIKTMNIDEIFMLVNECSEYYQKGYTLNFKDSVIFVIANLDEAYRISFDVNPDMSPDQFHEITKKLTIVDIKEALKRRFRNEQIARLGNIHVIYPSFSSETFKKIIQLQLDKYADVTLRETGYKLVFDKSINSILYKEGVFPTHGTRPVFSTVQEIVRSKLPFVIEKAYKEGQTIDTIKYSHSRGYTYAEVYKDDTKVGRYKFKEKLRVENLRESKKDDTQALVAVHESGHFVMYAKLFHKMPKSVRSVTTDVNSGGFMMPEIKPNDRPQSAKEILDMIKVSLGGYVAEEVIFGREHLTTGASSDLRKATTLASRYVRDYLLGNGSLVTTYLNDVKSTDCGSIFKPTNQDDIDKEIKQTIDKCWNEVRSTFKNYEWLKMLKASAKYLSENSVLPKTKMEEFYNLVSEKTRGNIGNEESYYKDIVSKF